MKRLFLLLGLILGFTLSSFAEAKTDTLYFRFELDDKESYYPTGYIDYHFSTKILDGDISIEYREKFVADNGEVIYSDHRYSLNEESGYIRVNCSGYGRIYYTHSSPTEYTAGFGVGNTLFSSVDIGIELSLGSLCSLDVSGCSALTELYCNNNELMTLNVSGCSALTRLNCCNNHLTSLDVSGFSSLTYLNCNNNGLGIGTFDISGCSALTYLDCSENYLTSLDVSGFSVLNSLNCSQNKLASLDVSGCTALTTCDLSRNYDYHTNEYTLTNLNVTGCSALIDLNCNQNKLEALDVSGFSALTTLDCSDNKLTSLDVSGCSALTTIDLSGNFSLTNLNLNGCSALTSLDCSNNKLTRLDVSDCSALTTLDCNNNRLPTLDVSDCSALTTLDCFSNQLTTLDVSSCSVLTTLDCRYNKLKDLNASSCSALTSLDCSYNKLTSLDVSGCSTLTTLDCNDNQLTTLDASGCSALTSLDCSYNKLTSLDVSGCSALTSLYCFSNQLTTLDVSSCSVLTSLDCRYNKLTGLNASGCSSLTSLYCRNNHIPLSTLYNVYTQTSDWSTFSVTPQSDTITLPVGQALDLSSEENLGGNTTNVRLYLDDQYCPDDYYTENDFTFLFRRPNEYRLSLSNSAIPSAIFDYYLSVKLPDGYFGIYVVASSRDMGTVTISGNGSYQEREEVTITATPSTGYRFINWTKADGSVFSTEAEYMFTATENLELTANFEEKEPFTINCYTNNSEWGYVYGANGTYREGEEVTIYADPYSHCHFVNWTKADGSVFSTEAEYTFTVTEDLALTANFGQDPSFTLTIHVNNSEWGYTYGANGTYYEGEEVTIYASPYDYDHCHFVNWTKADGGVFSTEEECTFTITEDLELTANFEQDPTFTLTVHVNNPEWGYTSGYDDGAYYEDEEITIHANPYYRCHFVNWTKADGSVFSTEAECTFAITEDLELTANFGQDPSFTLTIHVNNSEWGYTYGANGTYYEGEEVTIYASLYDYDHCHFVNWTKADGGVFSTEEECTFTITEDLELTANFEQDPSFTLTIHVNNSEWGYTDEYSDTYYEGDEVTIYASPSYHCHFVNWTKADGSVFSTEAECTFTITEDLELTANFEQDPTFTVSIYVNNSEWGYTEIVHYGYDDTYREGDEVRIYAYPHYGYRFVNWTKADGSVFSTEAEYTFTVTESLELTANFAPDGGVGNENRQGDNFSIYVQDRTIYLSENRGAVQVFNTAGQCIYNGSSTRIPVPHSGVYIVKVGTRSYKIIIR